MPLSNPSQNKGNIPTVKNVTLRSSVLVQVLIRFISIEVEANKRQNLCLPPFVTSSRTRYMTLETVPSDRKVKQKLSSGTYLARASKALSSIGLLCFSLISQTARFTSFPISSHWSMRSRKSSLFFIVSFEKGKSFSDLFRMIGQIYLHGKQDCRGCGQYRFAYCDGDQMLSCVDGHDNASQ